MFHIFFLQAGTSAIDSIQVATTTVNTESAFDIILKGGPVMIPLALLLVASIYLFIERFITIQKASQIDPNFMRNIKDYIVNGNIEGARSLCKATNSPVAKIIFKGIQRIGRPVKDIESAIENAGKIEINKLEKNVNILNTIAGLAPMFGFLGTIIGVITIFQEISIKNSIEIGTISGGLYVKMVTSAAGLFIGMLAFAAYSFLTNRIDREMRNMELSAIDFIDLLEEPASK
ncbi:MAG TPA: MotA/TolQ/ExbB proton channel family protein [Chitinophagales bacterium]|nr:MotA/TolQ/ExbB proton channel family protein [Chitinophagales bacterium]